MNRLLIVLAASCFLSFSSKPTICDTVNAVAQRHTEATLGFYAFDVSANVGICAYNSDKNLSPASTLKMLTTISALEILGADERFRTRFLYDGKIKNGTLQGNLIVIPDGDPTMGSRYFDTDDAFVAVANALSKKGILKIEGKLILNQNGFDTERIPANWSFDDLGNYYGASLAPFNWSDNTTFVSFKSGTAGSKTEIISIEPSVAELNFNNEVVAANIGYDNAYVYGAPRQYNRTIRGEIPANRAAFKIKASVPEPELFAMQCLVAQLRNTGIEVPYGAVSITENCDLETAELLIEVSSPTLLEIIAVTNIESNNLFAEALLKMIGHRKTGEWSRQKGLDVIKDFWKEKGIDLSAANLYDGSGLSRFNGISPKQIVEVLKYEYKSSLFADFRATLPMAGVSGSLKRMLQGSKAVNNLSAKSGYIEKVRSYCGYVTAANGHLVVFSVIINNYSCSATEARNELELIMKELAE